MRNDKQSSTRGAPDSDKAVVTDRMIRVVEGRGQRVIENGDRFVEGDSMFREISLGLRPIPFKLRRRILAPFCRLRSM